MNIIIRFDETGKMEDRQFFVDWVNSLKHGSSQWVLSATKQKKTPRRYAYLFGYLYVSYFLNCNDQVLTYDASKGDIRPVANPDELHEQMKLLFNPQKFFNQETGELHTVPGPTKGLEDADFYAFQDKVTAFLAELGAFENEAPMDQEEWTEQNKARRSYKLKEARTKKQKQN